MKRAGWSALRGGVFWFVRMLDRNSWTATLTLTGYLVSADWATVRGKCPVFFSGQTTDPKFTFGKATVREEADYALPIAGQDASHFHDGTLLVTS